MTVRIAINGYGRIGCNIVRAVYEHNRRDDVEIVAVNGLFPVDSVVNSTKYDSIHGNFKGDIHGEGDTLVINGDKIKISNERDPEKLPWKDLGIDVVCECTGLFRSREGSQHHLNAGAKKVLISAPGKDVDATIVYGVNDNTLTANDNIVSNASCTTNCLAPLAKVMNDAIGIESGLMNTVHAFTRDQSLLDGSHDDPRRGRSAVLSIVPTKTGAAAAVGLVLPELNGRLDGFAMRVPTANVSIVDLTFVAKRETTVEEVNELLKTAAEGELKKIMRYNDKPLVSIDFNNNPASSIVDADLTRVQQGKLVKVCAWYDNEWGFSNRMIDTSVAMMAAGTSEDR